jgi:hypothetical protein
MHDVVQRMQGASWRLDPYRLPFRRGTLEDLSSLLVLLSFDDNECNVGRLMRNHAPWRGSTVATGENHWTKSAADYLPPHRRPQNNSRPPLKIRSHPSPPAAAKRLSNVHAPRVDHPTSSAAGAASAGADGGRAKGPPPPLLLRPPVPMDFDLLLERISSPPHHRASHIVSLRPRLGGTGGRNPLETRYDARPDAGGHAVFKTLRRRITKKDSGSGNKSKIKK